MAWPPYPWLGGFCIFCGIWLSLMFSFSEDAADLFSEGDANADVLPAIDTTSAMQQGMKLRLFTVFLVTILFYRGR